MQCNIPKCSLGLELTIIHHCINLDILSCCNISVTCIQYVWPYHGIIEQVSLVVLRKGFASRFSDWTRLRYTFLLLWIEFPGRYLSIIWAYYSMKKCLKPLNLVFISIMKLAKKWKNRCKFSACTTEIYELSQSFLDCLGIFCLCLLHK